MTLTRKIKTAFTAAAILAVSCLPACAAKMRLKVPEKAPVGQAFYLQMHVNEEIGDVTVTWRGKNYTLLPKMGCIRTVLGVPNDKRHIGEVLPLTVEFPYRGQIIRAERELTVTDHHYPSEELTVAPRMINPAEKSLNRIASERKIVRKALMSETPGSAIRKPFVRPVPGIPTSYFGKYRTYNGVKKRGHGGLDLRAATGSAVKAVADGTVVLTGKHYYSGGAVYIDHGAGVITSYFHLSRPLVKAGQHVSAGQQIGRAHV